MSLETDPSILFADEGVTVTWTPADGSTPVTGTALIDEVDFVEGFGDFDTNAGEISMLYQISELDGMAVDDVIESGSDRYRIINPKVKGDRVLGVAQLGTFEE